RECPGRMKHRNPPTSLGLRLWTLACRRGLTVDCARLGRGQPGGGDGEGEAQEDHSEQYTAQVSPSSIPAPSQIRNGAVQLRDREAQGRSARRSTRARLRFRLLPPEALAQSSELILLRSRQRRELLDDARDVS